MAVLLGIPRLLGSRNIESIFAVTEQLATYEAASVTRLGNF